MCVMAWAMCMTWIITCVIAYMSVIIYSVHMCGYVHVVMILTSTVYDMVC